MLFRSPRERFLWASAGLYTLLIYVTLGVVRPATEFFRARGWLGPLIGLAFVLVAGAALVWLLRRRPSRRQWLALLGIALGYAAVFPFAYAPEERIHLIQYGLLAALILTALRERIRHAPARAEGRPAWPLRHPALTAILLTTALGWIDEGIQGLLPSRYYDLRDVAFNALAGALAVTALVVLRKAEGAGRPEEVGR